MKGTSKSANGGGSITARPDGRFEVRVTDPATGRRVSRYARTETAARRLLASMVGRAEDGAPVADGRATVRAYAEVWLTERAPRRRSVSTVREYRRRLEAYVIPAVGGVRLGALTVLDVEDLLDGLAARGLSASTIKGTRNALAAMLTDARRARHLRVNVAAEARLPELDDETAAPRDAPTPDEVLALLEAAEGTPLEALLVVLASTGARIGEALGAIWADLDLEAGVWRVARTVTVDEAGRAVLGTRGKTAAATRRVPLPPVALEALRAQRARVAALSLAAGPLWADHGLVFPSEVGTVWDPRNARKLLRPVAEAAGFPGSFHALRHAYATQAVAVLPSDAAVAKVLGHAKRATTTDLYAHLRAEDSAAVGGAVVASLEAARARRAGALASR